jgi:hypothetical protein
MGTTVRVLAAQSFGADQYKKYAVCFENCPSSITEKNNKCWNVGSSFFNNNNSWMCFTFNWNLVNEFFIYMWFVCGLIQIWKL